MIYDLSRKHSDKQVVQIQCTMKENVMDIVYMLREMIFHVLAITFNTKKNGFWNYEMTTCYVMSIYFILFNKEIILKQIWCYKKSIKKIFES